MYFKKMHGLGNDYIYVNCMKETIDNPSEVAIKISDRHYGVGSDGLILICPSMVADFRMEMYNADGTESAMCGNGIRCVGKYVYENNLTDKTKLLIETASGIKRLFLHVQDDKVNLVTVEMGEPELLSCSIPVITDKPLYINELIEIDNQCFHANCVSMGNPHTVIFVDEIQEIDINKLGPKIERMSIFPERTNVEFVEVINEYIIRMRVWERGTGLTLACGTGACASVVASVLNEYTKRRVDVILDGGVLTVDWNKITNRVSLRGPAEYVFEGQYER